MSKVERKEYQETKVMRTVSPVRNFRSSAQNLTEFDNNLDYLLEDLQSTISRPGSSLSQYRDTAKGLDSYQSNSLSRFGNAKSANPLTEYSSDDAYNYTSPDGTKRVQGFKKESYSSSYKSGQVIQPEKTTRTQSSINQLDSLLDDLQQVKSSSKYVEKESYNSAGSTPDYLKSNQSAKRELHYNTTPTRPTEPTYGDLRPLPPSSPSSSSRTSTLTKQTRATNVHTYPVEVVETTAPDINPEVLAHLDPTLHPPGNTKVTTTIKTYTYEIPGAGDYPTTLADTTNGSHAHLDQSASTPSKSFTYAAQHRSDDYHQQRKIATPPPPTPPTTNQTYYETRTNKSTEKWRDTPPSGVNVVQTVRNYQPSTNQTYVYNETTTTRNIDEIPRASQYTRVDKRSPAPNPPQTGAYVTESRGTFDDEIRTTRPPNPTDYKVYEHEREERTREHVPIVRPQQAPVSELIGAFEGDGRVRGTDYRAYQHEREEQTRGYVPSARPPPEPVNIQYKYKSESTTTNNYRVGGGGETPRFPHDAPDGPPRKLDDLMASIGHAPPNSALNAGYNAHEEDEGIRRKVETLKRQNGEVEDLVGAGEKRAGSKNVSGPPVYYPPGHEMFAKREGGWQMEGGYERERGKYEYGRESRSGEKKSGGKAIIPVCLPLCCGLPCTII